MKKNNAKKTLKNKTHGAKFIGLVDDLGHSLRQPINVMKNSVYFMKLKLENDGDEKVKKHLAIMEYEIRMIGSILEEKLKRACGKASEKKAEFQ